MLAKIKDTTKASDDEIGRNLMGLARARPDVFGETPIPSKAICSDTAFHACLLEGPFTHQNLHNLHNFSGISPSVHAESSRD